MKIKSNNVIFDNFGQKNFRKKLWPMVGFIRAHDRASRAGEGPARALEEKKIDFVFFISIELKRFFLPISSDSSCSETYNSLRIKSS